MDRSSVSFVLLALCPVKSYCPAASAAHAPPPCPASPAAHKQPGALQAGFEFC